MACKLLTQPHFAVCRALCSKMTSCIATSQLKRTSGFRLAAPTLSPKSSRWNLGRFCTIFRWRKKMALLSHNHTHTHGMQLRRFENLQWMGRVMLKLSPSLSQLMHNKQVKKASFHSYSQSSSRLAGSAAVTSPQPVW